MRSSKKKLTKIQNDAYEQNQALTLSHAKELAFFWYEAVKNEKTKPELATLAEQLEVLITGEVQMWWGKEGGAIPSRTAMSYFAWHRDGREVVLISPKIYEEKHKSPEAIAKLAIEVARQTPKISKAEFERRKQATIDFLDARAKEWDCAENMGNI